MRILLYHVKFQACGKDISDHTVLLQVVLNSPFFTPPCRYIYSKINNKIQNDLLDIQLRGTNKNKLAFPLFNGTYLHKLYTLIWTKEYVCFYM